VRLDPVKIVHSDELDLNTPQTSGMTRAAAITHARTGASKLWAGTMLVQPDAKTGPHHHGELETVLYVVKGRVRMRWGDQLEFSDEARTGRFYLRPALRAAPGDQCKPRRDLRSCSCEERTGSDCCQSRLAHSRTDQCGASRHAVSPRSLRIVGDSRVGTASLDAAACVTVQLLTLVPGAASAAALLAN
jgi:uncharacterized RmlC-like cupin family protein